MVPLTNMDKYNLCPCRILTCLVFLGLIWFDSTQRLIIVAPKSYWSVGRIGVIWGESNIEVLCRLLCPVNLDS